MGRTEEDILILPVGFPRKCRLFGLDTKENVSLKALSGNKEAVTETKGLGQRSLTSQKLKINKESPPYDEHKRPYIFHESHYPVEPMGMANKRFKFPEHTDV